MHLIPASHADVERLHAWVRDAEACSRWTGPLFPFPLPEHLYETLHKRGEQSFALADERHALGFGQILQRGEGWMHMARLIIDPAQRGRGYGRVLAQLLFEKALTYPDVEQITLYVLRTNVPAVRIYEQLGFRELENNPGDLNFPDVAFLTYQV